MEQKHEADQANDDAFLDELLAKRFHRMRDQGGAVIDYDQLHSLGEQTAAPVP